MTENAAFWTVFLLFEMKFVHRVHKVNDIEE